MPTVMENRQIAINFLECFCSGDIQGLATLLADDFQLTGPLYKFSSKDAYLESLADGPPEKCEYRVLSIMGSGDSVSIYYNYQKQAGAITIAQLFQLRNNKISEMLLVFDSSGFS